MLDKTKATNIWTKICTGRGNGEIDDKQNNISQSSVVPSLRKRTR
jgi:hypothetical protein